MASKRLDHAAEDVDTQTYNIKSDEQVEFVSNAEAAAVMKVVKDKMEMEGARPPECVGMGVGVVQAREAGPPWRAHRGAVHPRPPPTPPPACSPGRTRTRGGRRARWALLT